MSQLKVGIVGLPNVGKSTLFNALLKKQQAYVANFPFATIEPNVGIVPVPDERLQKLAEVTKNSENMDNLPPEIPATVEFLDIAGLVAGAHKGEGLGNKFLSHIREVNAICHVIRDFKDENIVKEQSVDPKKDFDTIETELKLADLQTLEKQKDPGNTPDKALRKRWDVIVRLREAVSKGMNAKDVELLDDEERKIAKELSLLTLKPTLVVINVDEDELKDIEEIEERIAGDLSLKGSQVIGICAKVEAQLADLDSTDQKAYLKDLGVKETGLERLIRKAFKTLGLITFLTAGEKEVRAWTIKKGENAKEASGAIHSDFMDKFIKADVCSFEDFTKAGGWKEAREKGKVRSEGKDYIVKDGDVVLFKIGQ